MVGLTKQFHQVRVNSTFFNTILCIFHAVLLTFFSSFLCNAKCTLRLKSVGTPKIMICYYSCTKWCQDFDLKCNLISRKNYLNYTGKTGFTVFQFTQCANSTKFTYLRMYMVSIRHTYFSICKMRLTIMSVKPVSKTKP